MYKAGKATLETCSAIYKKILTNAQHTFQILISKEWKEDV